MAENIHTVGRIVITAGANIITADRNVITMGINVTTTGRNVILSSRVITCLLCPLFLVIYHKMGDYHPGANKKLTKTLDSDVTALSRKNWAVIKIDQYTA